MKKTLATLTAIFLLGCDQLDIPNSRIKSDVAPNSNQRIEASSLENEIKINIKGTDPEKYAIQFSWPYLENEKVLRIRLGSVLAEVLPSQTFFTHILSHNQTVTFSFDILDKNRKPERTFTKTVRIPTDFVADSKNSLIKENVKIEVNRFYLNEEFPFTTNGNTVDIIANELHAEKGFIQSFPEKVKVINKDKNIEEDLPLTAADEKNARHGGNVSISAKKLFGKLKVYMRGETGGKGPKGDSTEGQKAGTGSPASNGDFVCIADPPDTCGRHGEKCLTKPSFIPRNCYCKTFGAPGGTGIQGDKGKPGKQGMIGGDTGNIRIWIHEYVPLEGFDPTLPKDSNDVIQVIQAPGNGGKGGLGGDGQRGSPGGEGRDPKNSDDCRGTAGTEGLQGAQGDEGPQGKEGKIGLKCIYVGSENVNECTQ
ncbi:MAG: hypothetical protein ACXVCP_08460 [Bdellovibrio sp.]